MSRQVLGKIENQHNRSLRLLLITCLLNIARILRSDDISEYDCCRDRFSHEGGYEKSPARPRIAHYSTVQVPMMIRGLASYIAMCLENTPSLKANL